jgi:hypothetical protein
MASTKIFPVIAASDIGPPFRSHVNFYKLDSLLDNISWLYELEMFV